MKGIGSFLTGEVQNLPTEGDGDRAMLIAVGQIANFAERISTDFREQNGEIALLTFARTLRATSHKTWAK